MKFFAFALCLSLAPNAFAELFGGGSHPSNFNRIAGINIMTDFNFLPLRGKLSDDRLGWSETYWPSNRGGIAYRWNHPDPQPFKYKLYSKEELKRMNQKELGELSPAELYDIANSDYNYTVTRRAFGLYSTRDTWWEGICHGWAQAAINYPEPAPVTITNNDGISVPFGSSDVKALLAMHEAYNYKGQKFAFAGKRCRVNGKVEGESDDRDHPSNRNFPPLELANSEECRDVNAGAFHVIISNMIGLLGKGFVADVDRFNDVWNQPITNYEAVIVGEEPGGALWEAQGVSRRLRVQMKMTYGEELQFYTPELAAQGKKNFVSKLPVTGTPHQEFKSKNYEYILELNSAGKIVGGEWISQTRPDFMWLYGRSEKFKNAPIPLSNLKYIYRPVRR